MFSTGQTLFFAWSWSLIESINSSTAKLTLLKTAQNLHPDNPSNGGQRLVHMFVKVGSTVHHSRYSLPAHKMPRTIQYAESHSATAQWPRDASKKRDVYTSYRIAWEKKEKWCHAPCNSVTFSCFLFVSLPKSKTKTKHCGIRILRSPGWCTDMHDCINAAL